LSDVNGDQGGGACNTNGLNDKMITSQNFSKKCE
jgi:hypothetical protein